jgi:hypothetical protein
LSYSKSGKKNTKGGINMGKDKGRYRVLLMCKKCEKVYNGTPLIDFAEATKWFHNTLRISEDTCKNEGCEEPLIAEIQDMEKPKEEK